MKIITNEIETKTINSMYGLVKIHKKKFLALDPSSLMRKEY